LLLRQAQYSLYSAAFAVIFHVFEVICISMTSIFDDSESPQSNKCGWLFAGSGFVVGSE
jgi:hypothetical protein